MSAPTYIIRCPPVALAAAATQTLILLTPAVVDNRIIEFGVSFDGSAAATAIEVQLYRVATLGSPVGAAGVFSKSNKVSAQSPQSTALTALTTEPTSVTVLKSWYVSPATGSLTIQFPQGREPESGFADAKALGLRVITPAGVTPHALSYLEIEE